MPSSPRATFRPRTGCGRWSWVVAWSRAGWRRSSGPKQWRPTASCGGAGRIGGGRRGVGGRGPETSRTRGRLGREGAAGVEPLYPAGLPVILPPGTESSGLGLPVLDELRKVEELAGVHGGGSNNWVIDGSPPTTGKPLV